MKSTARQKESLVYPVKTETPPIVAYTLMDNSIFASLIIPILKMNKPTN